MNNNNKWSLAAVEHIFKTKIARRPTRSLESMATKTWEIAPSETSIAPPAFYLSNQLERVTGWNFATQHPKKAMEGGTTVHGATRGYLIHNVWLIDGSLYKKDAYNWLLPKTTWHPQVSIETEVDQGALYCTPMGNKYFGQWLMDDCATYALAINEGTPVTTSQPLNQHTVDYELRLGIKPTRLHNAFFRKLVIFEDVGQNRNKHLRFRNMSDKILSHLMPQPHPGVFILRGGTGELRLLQNEIQLAEHLQKYRGFRILDPMKTNVATIISVCAGAEIVVGVEGSQLIHGILVLKPGGALLTLQPPNRFVQVFKDLTDRDHQSFGFVVGTPEGKGFRIVPDEVERTLDLFPK